MLKKTYHKNSNLMTSIIEKKEIFKFYSLFIITVFVVYYTPDIFSQLVFLFFIILFLKSKKNYFWFAFIFVLYVEPNGLFSGQLFSEFQKIPIYNFGEKLIINFFDFFFIAVYFKFLLHKKRMKLILSNPLRILLGFMIFSYLYSIVLGMTLSIHFFTIRNWLPFLLFFSFPSLVDSEKDYLKFMYLLFPMILFVLTGQIFEIVFGIKLASLLLGDINLIASLNDIPEYTGLLRVINASYLSFFCFLFSLFLLNLKSRINNKFYIYVILSASIFSIYLSATRGWIIAFIIILFLYFLRVENNIFSTFGKIALITILIFILLQFSPTLKKQTKNVADRLMTMKALIQGDITAQNTLSRLNIRGPKVMRKYWEHPVFGWGVSFESYRNWDGHVGNQSLLMQAGIVGFILFFYYLFSLVRISFQIEKKISKVNKYKNSLHIFSIALFGLFIIHSSSAQMFGLIAKQRTNFIITLFFLFFHFFIRLVINEEKELQIFNKSK